MPIVQTEDRGTVRHVVLDRPEKRNALNGELVQAPRKVALPSMLRIRRSFVDRALAAPLQGH